jgi:hypothetical protein
MSNFFSTSGSAILMSSGRRQLSATQGFDGTKWNHGVSDTTVISAARPTAERNSYAIEIPPIPAPSMTIFGIAASALERMQECPHDRPRALSEINELCPLPPSIAGMIAGRHSVRQRLGRKEGPMSIDRAVMAVAGFLILLSLLMSQVHSVYWLWLTAFVGANLLQASFTGFCPAAYVFRWLGLRRDAAFS